MMMVLMNLNWHYGYEYQIIEWIDNSVAHTALFYNRKAYFRSALSRKLHATGQIVPLYTWTLQVEAVSACLRETIAMFSSYRQGVYQKSNRGRPKGG